MNIRQMIEYIRDANDLAEPHAFGNHTPENIEYFRGQVEMLRHIMGYEDDGYSEDNFILGCLGVRQDIFKYPPERCTCANCGECCEIHYPPIG